MGERELGLGAIEWSRGLGSYEHGLCDRAVDGQMCRAGAVTHFWLDYDAGDGQPILWGMCSEHAIALRREHGDKIAREHAWRRGGSACGVPGVSWYFAENVCRPDPDSGDTDPAMVAFLDELATAAA